MFDREFSINSKFPPYKTVINAKYRKATQNSWKNVRKIAQKSKIFTKIT